jgi:hypothetical protein
MDQRDAGNGRFLPGNTGGGRPKGSRNKLGEEFVAAVYQDFEQHGADVIVQVRQERPHEYLKVIAGILPKEMKLEAHRPVTEMSREELLLIAARGLEQVVPQVSRKTGCEALAPPFGANDTLDDPESR